MNNLLILIFLIAMCSLFSALSSVNAEIKAASPPNWQPSPNNNSTSMVWTQNSTKSFLVINQAPSNFPSLPLVFVGPMIAQLAADEGVLESTDQITFGRSNYGYRYFLNFSDPMKMANSSGFGQPGSIIDLRNKGYDVPFKGMVILTEKQGSLAAILFLSPRDNFDSVSQSIKPTIDSIQLTKSANLTN